jgi:hypothetical protein
VTTLVDLCGHAPERGGVAPASQVSEVMRFTFVGQLRSVFAKIMSAFVPKNFGNGDHGSKDRIGGWHFVWVHVLKTKRNAIHQPVDLKQLPSDGSFSIVLPRV